MCKRAPHGRVGCFAIRVDRYSGGRVAHADSPVGLTPSDLHSAYALPATGPGTRRPATVAIVDAYDDPNAEADLRVYRAQFGLPPCTSCERLLPQGRPERRAPLPARRRGLGAGDLARPRHGVGDLPDVQHPAGRGDEQLAGQPRRGGQHRGAAGGQRHLQQLRRPRRIRQQLRPLLPPPRRRRSPRRRGDSGYGVSYPASSKWVTAVGGTTLTQVDTREARLARERLVRLRQRLLDAQQGALAVRPRRRTAPGERWPTSLPWPIPRPASPSTTATPSRAPSGWLTFGGTSAAAPIIAAAFALAGNTAVGEGRLLRLGPPRRRRQRRRQREHRRLPDVFVVHRQAGLGRPDRLGHAEGFVGALTGSSSSVVGKLGERLLRGLVPTHPGDGVLPAPLHLVMGGPVASRLRSRRRP